MKLLLDTHTLLWALGYERKLPPTIKRMIESSANTIVFSAASLLVIATKRSSRSKHPDWTSQSVLNRARAAEYEFLAVEARHAVALETIAPFHGDPIDRLLLAQAQTEGMRLVTHDAELAAYDSRAILF